jgi:hypothetical protein
VGTSYPVQTFVPPPPMVLPGPNTTHKGSEGLWQCYKYVIQRVRRAVAVLQKCDTKAQKGCGSVTKVWHKGSEGLWQCYKSVTQRLRRAVAVLQKCDTCVTGSTISNLGSLHPHNTRA